MLTNTGERMIPEAAPVHVFWEHIYRYSFAAHYCKGREVLDIACGEGYGAAAFARIGAKRVVGVDNSMEACKHARTKHSVEALLGDATAIPIPNESVDLVVSFETIEHIHDPLAFVGECIRVLRPGGQMILSTPNRDIYRKRCPDNQFHVSEMTFSEFDDIFSRYFQRIEYFTQHPFTAAHWSRRALAADYLSSNPQHFVNRALRLLRRVFVRSVSETKTSHYREDPVAAVLDRKQRLSDCFNQFPVRPLSRLAHEEPYFYLGVGTKRM
jgi:ubiquinone/menaquinone biosynthesis C-methylase UbiE